MERSDSEITRFLNVDLDIRAPQDLSKLLAAFDTSMMVLNATETTASLELRTSRQSLDETLAALITNIRLLSPDARQAWNSCTCRQFNIGIRAGKTPHSTEFAVSEQTIASLLEVKGELVLTIYVE